MKIDCEAVRCVMRELVEGCIERGEINHTKLAEEAASELALYEDKVNYTIPEEVFELALEFEDAPKEPGGWCWKPSGKP